MYLTIDENRKNNYEYEYRVFTIYDIKTNLQ